MPIVNLPLAPATAVKVPLRILADHVRTDTDSSAEFKQLCREVRDALRAYRAIDPIIRTPDSIRLKRLLRLQETLKQAVAAYRALDDTTRRFHLPDQWTTDARGYRVPAFDIEAFIDRATRSVDEAVGDLTNAARRAPKHQRPSEAARTDLLIALAVIFKAHYRLEAKEYGGRLRDFIEDLLAANNITYPESRNDLLKHIPKHLTRI
jgi:hypothetical protein